MHNKSKSAVYKFGCDKQSALCVAKISFTSLYFWQQNSYCNWNKSMYGILIYRLT